MKILNHILLSVFFHASLLGILLTIRPMTGNDVFPPAFNVRIVGPAGMKRPAPQIPALPKARENPAVTMPRERELPPETLFGNGVVTGGHDESIETAEEATGTGKGFSDESGEDLGRSGDETPFAKGQGEVTGDGHDPSPDTKTFLFDSEVIEKYARKSDTEDRDVTFDVPEFHHRGYMRMLKNRIERIWRYPSASAQQRVSGDLFIRFTIQRDGSLGDIKLLRTSGHNELDEAAIQAVRGAEPFWPLPDDWEKDELTINGHFIYIIGRSYML